MNGFRFGGDSVTGVIMQGKFITFEGIEGCGKSTQAKLLGEWLASKGVEVTLTREPGGTELGVGIRQALLHLDAPVSPAAEILLFQADRNQHVVQTIRPALEAGKWVISDRYYHSTLAYQAGGRKIPMPKVRELVDFAIEGLEPEVVFFVDVPVEIGIERKRKANDSFDRIEKETREFHESIRRAYIEMSETDERVVRIDGSRSVEEIYAEIIDVMNRLFFC